MPSIKLVEQWAGEPGKSQFKGYRKFIKGRMFTLGVDKAMAERKAEALTVASKGLSDGWTDEIIQQAIELATGIAATRRKASETTYNLPTAVGRSMSVDDAIEKFQAVILQDYKDRKFDGEHYRGSKRRLEAMKLGLAGKHFAQFLDQPAIDKAVANGERGEIMRLKMDASKQARDAASDFLKTKALNDLTEENLLAAKRYFTNRPISVKKGTPISVTYVSNIIHMMSRFFEYAERRLQWNAPPYWKVDMKFARNQKRNMMSLSERSDAKAAKDHMTKDDVKSYYKMGTTRCQALQALAWWCGWTQIELSTFRKVEMFDEGKETYIDKSRSKTGEWGKWWIPEPVAKLVRAEMAKTPDDQEKNPHGLAFMTENGFPLVHGGERDTPDTQKTDIIAGYLWQPIQRQAKKAGRSHSFKWFRKSSAQRIQDLTKNPHVAKAFLAQSVGDVSEKYLNALVDESMAAAKQLWEEMKDIYDPNLKAKKAKKKKAA